MTTPEGKKRAARSKAQETRCKKKETGTQNIALEAGAPQEVTGDCSPKEDVAQKVSQKVGGDRFPGNVTQEANHMRIIVEGRDKRDPIIRIISTRNRYHHLSFDKYVYQVRIMGTGERFGQKGGVTTIVPPQ